MGRVTAIQMWSDSTGAGAATLDVPENGQIISVDWTGTPIGMDALDDFYTAELSFSASSQRSINDARGAVAHFTMVNELLTSGGGVATGKSVDFGGHGIPVAAGERLFLHITRDTGVSGEILCMVYFVFGRVPSRASARRA